MDRSFAQFWTNSCARTRLLSYLPKEDLASLRLTCQNFGAVVAPSLFEDVHLIFRSATFTRHARVAALERIGHHIKGLHFEMPHSSETFLPPLIDSTTGETVNFIYEPYTYPSRDPVTRQSHPCYGDWEITDLLTRQYPPLFHAAANVPSFIRAFSTLRNLKHLKVSCPSQEHTAQCRRSIVDYALISLRIAVERSQLPNFKTLSLLDIHPEASFYLSPNIGFGTLPNSPRRWKQIRNLRIHMRSSLSASGSHGDHLKHLQNYLQVFSPNLRKLDFAWLGERNTCPIVQHAGGESDFSSVPFLASEVDRQPSRPLRFAHLRDLKVRNTTMAASHIADFIVANHRVVRHTRRLRLKFNETTLSHGTWDEALAPLTEMSGSDSWRSSSEESCEEPTEEYMDVPIMFSHADGQENELHKVWNDHVTSRSFRPHYSSLQRAGAKTRELLFGTEEHMRKLFSTAVFGWR